MNYILEFLLYSPRVYSGLDHLMVEVTAAAAGEGNRVVCVFCDTMEYMPAIGEDIAHAGGVVEVISSRKRQMYADIRRLYRKYRPQVVDTHFCNDVKVLTALLSKCYGAKHFTHVHSLLGDSVEEYVAEKGRLKRVALGCYHGLMTKWSKRVFCISEAIHRQYGLWSYRHCRNVETLYIGTQIVTPHYTQAEARAMLGIPADAWVLTNVSAIEPIKGIDLILRAVAALKEQGVPCLFVHIGGLRSDTEEQRQYADSLRALAEELGIADRVRWLGRRADVQDILPFADVYVHPSRSEGLGSVLLEASIAHLPLVGTAIGGIPEIVQEGKTGLLVPSDDAEALATAVAALSADKAAQIGENAYRYVCEHFNQHTQALALWEEYKG